ncbi:cleavage and polyadenylation specificity factor subunit 2 [Kappamyces sp. JEL0829]|nr:cleavage and polyadenylation specificity factor subunit 2 [Kappamyces sp. JEL0829]KAJ3369669.1 cleavage and polyadenylation specificity factor subunit 2 [Kappamyces sp. JEL0680]
MQDVLTSKLEQYDYKDLTLDQVNKAFGKISLLRYSQPYTLGGKCAGIVITAFGAGHTVGTIWKIKKDNEDIVYAVDFNHRKEAHLNGTVLMSTDSLVRPSLLITDAYNVLPPTPSVTRKLRDIALIDTLSERLAASGNILIPVQTSTRVLELAYTLDEYWKKHNLSFHLVFLSHQSQSTIVYAKSMLEWMGDSISQNFQSRDQPFDFRHLKCLTSIDEINNLHGPKVVLASFPSLEYGLAHDLLWTWADQPRNCVCFTERPPFGSLGYLMYEQWLQHGSATQMVPLHQDISLQLGKRVPLEGEELEEFLAREAEREALKEKDVNDIDLANLSDSDEEIEETGGLAGAPGLPVYDIYVKDHVDRKGFFKQSQAFRMYPVHEVRNRVDDYGELLDLTMFSKFEQKVPEDDMLDDDVELPDPEENIIQAIPSKYIVEDAVLSLRCFVFYVDFEGRCDEQSLYNIIQQLSPRKLMIVHGSERSTKQMLDYCRASEHITDELFAPALFEKVTVSTATNLYQVVLTDSLVSSLKLSQLNEYNLAYISGIIKTQETPQGQQLILEPLPPTLQKQRKAVSVGDVKFSELKRHLAQQGFKAQFAAGGILVVNDRYVIQKNVQGAITIQGRVQEDYYRLREVIYGFQAMLQ